MLTRQGIAIVAASLAFALLAALAGPAAVWGNGIGSIYVADQSSGNVYIIDPVSKTTVAVVALPDRSHAMAFSSDGQSVYVANTDGASLAVIDTVDEAMAETIAAGRRPAHLALSPNGRHVYLSDEAAGALLQIDLAEHRVAQTLSLGGRPHGLAISPNGRYVYVANETSNVLHVVDTVGWKLASSLSLPGNGVSHVALAPGRDRAYVAATASDAIIVLNTTTGAVEATIAVAPGPTTMAIAPSGRYLYSVHDEEAALSIVDTEKATATRVALPAPASGIVLSGDGDFLYLASSGAKGVFELDAQYQLVDTIKVPGKPGQLAMSPIHGPTPPAAGPPLTIPARLPRTGGATALFLVGAALPLLILGWLVRRHTP